MRRGGLLIAIGIVVLLIFLGYFIRQGSLDVPGLNLPSATPAPSVNSNLSPTSTPSSNLNRDLTATVEIKNNLRLFFAALRASGLDNTLKSGGPYTVFAPSDTAVISNLNNLPKDISSLRSILQYHVVQGNYTSNDLVGKTNLKTIRGDDLFIDLSKGNGVTMNGVKISEPDIRASNGIVHVIDGVLTQ